MAWVSKMSSTTPVSTMEAEMIALKEGALTMAWLKTFLEDLNFGFDSPIVMFQDNKGVVDTVLLDSYRHRLRHQMNTVLVVRELVRNEVIKVVACKTQKQLADLGTKVLGKNIFQELIGKIYPRQRNESEEIVEMAECLDERRDFLRRLRGDYVTSEGIT